MNCKKCQKVIPAESLYCNWCGAKQIVQTRKKRKRPNGSGSVIKLSGNRTKPFAAYLPGGKNGKGVYIGTYKTETEAFISISKMADKNITDTYNFTIKQYYDKWSALHFPTLTRSGEQGYKTALRYLAPIEGKHMKDIKTTDFQRCIDLVAAQFSRAQCEKVKQLCSQLCKCAMQDDVINKNYAEFLILPKGQKKEKVIFNHKEIETLFANQNDERVQIILTLIYTGFRINELFSVLKADVDLSKQIMVGGSKTEAGINRTVPISNKVLPFVINWYESSETEFLLKKDVNNFRKREFYPALIEYGILKDEKDHRITPHSCRHTFASLCAQANVKPELLQKLIGHADYATTADIYIHSDIESLKNAIQLL